MVRHLLEVVEQEQVPCNAANYFIIRITDREDEAPPEGYMFYSELIDDHRILIQIRYENKIVDPKLNRELFGVAHDRKEAETRLYKKALDTAREVSTNFPNSEIRDLTERASKN